MIGIRQFLLGRCTAFLLGVALVFQCAVGQAAEPSTNGQRALLAKYQAIKAKLENNQFGAPIYLESVESGKSVRVDMHGIFNHPFGVVRDALQSPANWCDITSLHINIKACTSRQTADQWLLTLYSGRKHYQPPSDAYPLRLKFRIVSQQPDYLDVALSANEGPLRTRDHRIRLQAVPLDKGRTLVHFSYVYGHGAVARTAIKSYFSTLARDKVGFSVIGSKSGKPVYIGGVRGSIERNTVRYYLALDAFLDSLKLPQGRRLEQRMGRWYDLTARYPQLKEVEKSEYLNTKRRERTNQLALQKQEAK